MKRKELFRGGKRGDRIRVVVDTTEKCIIAYYRTTSGVPKKKKFDDTKDGRAEAVAWAESFHATRKQMESEKAAPRKINLVELWAQFTEAPAFTRLRDKSKVGYTGRFKKWMTYLTADHCPDDTTLLDVDNYFTRCERAGVALNQARQVVNTARIVYRWGQTRKLVKTNELSLFRFQRPTDAKIHEPEEYTAEEVEKLINATNPQSGLQWRINVMLLLGSHQGMRANALTHLRWDDLEIEANESGETDGCIIWPAEYQKNGREFRQPLTFDAVAALETAWYWREVTGYTGPWVLFGGGGNKKLGARVGSSVIRPREGQPTTTSYARSYRKERTAEQDVPVTYQGMHTALIKLEKSANVEHKPLRGFHGLRKHAAGNVADVTGDSRLAMEWINDKPNSKFMAQYLKGRSERLDRAAAAAGGKKP